MEQADQRFLRDFFQKLARQELSGTDDELYVRIYDHPEVASDDPVNLLARGIEWTPGGSVQLFSGFRGTGKSTELRRLMERLEDSGFLVVLYDVEDYVNLHTPVDVADFLIALAGGFGEALAKKGLLKGDPAQRSYWERFRKFLTDTNVEIDGVSFEAGGVGLQAALTWRRWCASGVIGDVCSMIETSSTVSPWPPVATSETCCESWPRSCDARSVCRPPRRLSTPP